MTLTRVLNDPRATAACSGGRDTGHEMGSQKLESKIDAKGPVYELGRGVTDPAITYVALYNTSGVKCYLFPNAAGNGVTCSTTKP